MAEPTVEERLQALEQEVARLKSQVFPEPTPPDKPWWELWHGVFRDDPMFDEAMRLGAEYRRSQVPPGDDVPA